MSETKSIEIPAETRRKLSTISELFSKLNTGATGDNFWIASDQGDSGYDWGQIDLGVDKSGALIVCRQGGCSCNGPEEPTVDVAYPLTDPIKIEEESYYREEEPAVRELIDVTDTIYDVLTGVAVDAEKIIALPNAEIRRAVVELVGYDKIVDRAEVIDESERDGRLIKIAQQDDEDIYLIHVKDPSTDREYFLRVPPNMKTARQARAWTFGFSSRDFELEKES